MIKRLPQQILAFREGEDGMHKASLVYRILKFGLTHVTISLLRAVLFPVSCSSRLMDPPWTISVLPSELAFLLCKMWLVLAAK